MVPVSPSKASPLIKPASPHRTNGYVITAPPFVSEERLESRLSSCASDITSWPVPPTKPESTADSGYDEPEATTSHSAMHESVPQTSMKNDYLNQYRVPFTDDVLENDPRECLLEENERDDRTAANLDSCDSGIGADYHSVSTTTNGSVCNGSAYQYYSPKAGLRSHAAKNGITRIDSRSPSNAKKLIDPAALEAQRLIC